MATLAAVLATTHHPFYLKATTMPPEQQMPQAPEGKRKIEAYRETLTRAKPDILVMIGADHFHQFFLDNYPQFLIGKAPRYDATFYNEEREFGIPKYVLEGHEELSNFMHPHRPTLKTIPSPMIYTYTSCMPVLHNGNHFFSLPFPYLHMHSFQIAVLTHIRNSIPVA